MAVAPAFLPGLLSPAPTIRVYKVYVSINECHSYGTDLSDDTKGVLVELWKIQANQLCYVAPGQS